MNLKNHHGWIVTSPTGSVSLRDLPVPVHETKEKASRWGKAQGKPFVITTASKFYATDFGKTVQILTRKKLSQVNQPKEYMEMFLGHSLPEKLPGHFLPKPSKLTSLLNRLRQKDQEKAFEAKVDRDTKIRYTKRDPLAKQMRVTGEALDASRSKMADKSYLLQAMQPPKDEKIHRASDNDLMSLFLREEPERQKQIDRRAKCAWTKARFNKFVKTKDRFSILTLFRAGQLPEKLRTNKELLKEINARC